MKEHVPALLVAIVLYGVATAIAFGLLGVYVTGTLYYVGVVSHGTVITATHWCAMVGLVYGGIGGVEDYVEMRRLRTGIARYK